MATLTATVSADTGPGEEITSLAIAAKSFTVDVVRGVVTFFLTNGQVKEFDLVGVTTLTDTITGGNHVVVVS